MREHFYPLVPLGISKTRFILLSPITFVKGSYNVAVFTKDLSCRAVRRLRRGPTREIPNPVHRRDVDRLCTLSDENLVSTVPPSSECILLNLPPEVRRLIWAECLGGHLLCVRFTEGSQPTSRRKPMVPRHLSVHHLSKCGSDVMNPVALLQTNRQVYREALPFLYQHNKFDLHAIRDTGHRFGHPRGQYLLHHFLRSMPEKRVANIHRIQMQFTEIFQLRFDWLTEVPALKQLVVALSWTQYSRSIEGGLPSWWAAALDHCLRDVVAHRNLEVFGFWHLDMPPLVRNVYHWSNVGAVFEEGSGQAEFNDKIVGFMQEEGGWTHLPQSRELGRRQLKFRKDGSRGRVELAGTCDQFTVDGAWSPGQLLREIPLSPIPR